MLTDDSQMILINFSNDLKDVYGFVRVYEDKKIDDDFVVNSNMVLAPQYLETTDGVRIVGWGLVPASQAVKA